ncbi:MAG: 1-acyl-sn-glycerol-3-phosphate acyltransferase [Chlorobi bacterium]|nr:1-acyl-sn-glycerol-3-phosphate acyltransferase [Chlorobiota bacterium]
MMKAWIQSVLVWLFVVVSLIIIFPLAILVWIVSVPFDKRRVVFHFFTSIWGSLYTWLAPFWSVNLMNREKIQKGKVYIMVSNHQSMLDILVLCRLFAHFKWVSKDENFKVPVIGWVMIMNRYIRLKRGKRSGILHMMRDGKKTLEQGSSLMIFPEGTRSETTEMRNFKEGAFRLAKETNTPLLPIVLDGTGNALPKHGFVIRGRHNMTVKVLDEIPVNVVNRLGATELKEETYRIMSAELNRLRNPKL